jgi:dethiobiotin synthetase
MSSTAGRAVLVTGTDTGVGKTFVTAGLAQLLRERGVDVGVMKPVETGWPAEWGRWPADAESLREAAQIDDPVEDVVPYVFQDPVAPQVCADRARIPIEMSRIRESLDRLRTRHQVVLVEGAGGLAVPLDDGLDFAGMAEELDLPILVVARAHLGTLNHTFLTVHYARARGLQVLGVIANRLERSLVDPSTSTNPSMIARMCDVPVLGVVPFEPEADSMAEVSRICGKCIDVDRLLGLIFPPIGEQS